MGGFSIVPLAQKARTKTLIADSDLNLGNYDLIATDVKGDTAEFAEFVGGVGNFSNVLGSGNLDIEGTASIKGNTQIDGNIVLEGAINNVNIADNGEITTSQGVNGADFNGATITSTKFNGATINSSGDYSGRKGTFTGAVSGTTGTFSGAVSGTTGTFSGAVTVSGLITANGGVKGSLTGNATTATNLSRTVTVGASSQTMILSANNVRGIVNAVICPYTPGVLYTGTIKAFTANAGVPGTMYTLSSSNVWSTTSIDTTSAKAYTITNVKTVILTNGDAVQLTVHLPTFT